MIDVFHRKSSYIKSFSYEHHLEIILLTYFYVVTGTYRTA